MYPYTTIDPQAFANEQAMLQQRINQLEQARNQQMSMYAPQSQQQQQAPTSNVKESPTNAELGAKANWSLAFNHKNIRMGLIKSNG